MSEWVVKILAMIGSMGEFNCLSSDEVESELKRGMQISFHMHSLRPFSDKFGAGINSAKSRLARKSSHGSSSGNEK